MFKKSEVNCYCAFCRVPRKIYRKKSLSWVNAVQALLNSSFFSWVFWGRFEAKGLLIFIACLGVIETLILWRSRLSVECPECGFDAYLYLKDKNAACAKVKARLETRKNDPDVWLARRAPMRLPSQKVKRKKGSTRELIA